MDDFLRRRVLRIYPGFIVALFVSTVIMTVANSAGLFHESVSWRGLKAFVRDGVFLSSPSLTGPAVFPGNPFPNTANGSMWTIRPEFSCYLTVCAIGLFGFFRFRWLIGVAFICMYLLYSKAVILGLDVSSMDKRFFTYFLSGSCAWLWRDKIVLHWVAALLAFMLSLASFFTPFWPLLGPFSLAYLALWIGYAHPVGALRWCDATDLSYGVYLYAFPVQQLIAMNDWGRNPYVMLFVGTAATLAAALLSWHLVEKRFMAMKSSRFFDRGPVTPPAVEAATQERQLKQAF